MKKLDSIVELERRSLNTIPAMLFTPGMAYIDVYRELGRRRLAVRTERGDDRECPFLLNLNAHTALIEARLLTKQGYGVLICHQPAVKCLANGSFATPTTGDPFLEYVAGPGTQRDIKDQSLTRLTFWSQAQSQLEHRLLDTVFATGAGHIRAGEIAEWSLFAEPVGRLEQQDIWWEIRKWQ